MIPLENLLAFAAAAFVIVILPGPTVVFVVGRALAYGRRSALAGIAGNAAATLVLVTGVAFGLGTLFERSVLFLTVLKLAGAAYLVYLGVRAIRNRREVAALEASGEHGGTRRAIRDGFMVGITNPKSLLFFPAVLPQFVAPEAGYVPAQMFLLGALFITLGLITDCVWGLLAGTARTWLGRSRRRLELIGGAGGASMIGLGAAMALTGRPSN